MLPRLVIRPFTDDDYQFLAVVDAVVYGQPPQSAEWWQRDDAGRDPALLFARHVVEAGGRTLGCGEVGHSRWIDDADTYQFQILVPPDAEDPRARPAYLDFALKTLAARGAKALVCGMLESRVAHVRFLEGSGFREVHREHWSRLRLGAFDPGLFAGAVARVADQAIRVVRLADLQREVPDWRERLYPVYEELVADQPAAHPPRLSSFERWERSVLGAPDFDPRLWFLALDGDRIVGLSEARFAGGDASSMRCGLTGVVAAYRRRGIATALKVELLAAARDRGGTEITTSNEVNNPMYRINLGLGFRPGPDWVMYEKTLRATAGGPRR